MCWGGLYALSQATAVPTHAADGAIEINSRRVPVSGLISPQARESIEKGAVALASRPAGGFPPASADKELWKRAIAAADAAYAPMIQAIRAEARASVQKSEMAGVPVYVATPLQPRADRRDQAILHIHGGGFAMLADGPYAEAMAAEIATLCGCTVYSANYRTPPDFPYPTPVEDSLAVYRALLKVMNPADIVVRGGIGGRNHRGVDAAQGSRCRFADARRGGVDFGSLGPQPLWRQSYR